MSGDGRVQAILTSFTEAAVVLALTVARGHADDVRDVLADASGPYRHRQITIEPVFGQIKFNRASLTDEQQKHHDPQRSRCDGYTRRAP